MPFTPAHPAAILPFVDARKSGGWNAGLVFGSMVPDLLLPIDRVATHSLWGAVVYDVPAALAGSWIWCRILAPRFAKLPGLRLRTDGLRRPSGLSSALVAVSIGVFTHLAWDALTHDGSAFGQDSALSGSVLRAEDGVLPTARLLWYASSALGLSILFLRLRAFLHSNGGRFLDLFRHSCWRRLATAAIAPFVVPLHASVRGQHDSIVQLLSSLTRHAGQFHVALAVSTILVLLVAWRETRNREDKPHIF